VSSLKVGNSAPSSRLTRTPWRSACSRVTDNAPWHRSGCRLLVAQIVRPA
jgi:hypothetical protein